MIEFKPVKSSAVHSVGFDSQGSEVHILFHETGCASKAKGDCNCAGRSPTAYKATADEHQALLSAPSVGAHFSKVFRGRPARSL